MDEHSELTRLYGPWRDHRPAEAAALFSGYPGRWWIAGGWTIDAFTGIVRDHDDLDLSIPRSDLPILRRYLAGRLDVWAADSGTLRPLIGLADEPLPATCENLWLRPNGADPWEYDVILMDISDSRWHYKRDRRVTRGFDDILWTKDGITYLRPEVQLLHKARGLRPKDQRDFETCRPFLDATSRNWLMAALDLAHPGHPWSDELRREP
ncbi:MAG: nucleotidyltransferase domain-containing protein [Bradyrhizobium sp.]